jgi:hypothetical protein
LLNEGEVTTTAAAGQNNNTNAAGQSAPRPEREHAARRNYLRNTSLDDAWSASSSTSPADGTTVQVFQEWNSAADRSRSTTAAEGETVSNFEAQLMLSEGRYFFVVREGSEGVSVSLARVQ